MTGDSANDSTIKSPLSNILNKSVFIHSHTTVRPDGRVQSYCGLKLADIPASGADLRQDTVSGSKYAHTRARRRSAGPSLIGAAKKTPKGAALTSAGIHVAYHNLGPPSYTCPGCHVVMWYEERNDKAKRAVNPTFSLCYQEGKKSDVCAFVDNESRKKVDENIVTDLTQMLDHSNPIVRSFRMAKEWCHSNPSTEFGLRLLSERKTTRQYNTPTISKVAALIINDFDDGEPSRDIIVIKTNYGPQRISKLHPSFMALQYPLLFPYGEDGFHEHIPYHRNTGEQKTKRGDVTMKEYY
ncbi:hypothetical protein Tco_0033362 [Tanacetum coccineum]